MTLFVQFLISGIFLGAIYGLISVGIVLLVKSTGIFNFAHGTLAALGAFFFWTFLVKTGLPLILSLVLCLVACGILAFLIERLALRPLIGQPLLAAMMVTIGLGEIFSGLVTLVWPGPGRSFGALFLPQGNIRMGSLVLSHENLSSFAVCLVALVIFAYFFKNSKLGMAMRGAAENQKLAQSGGIQVTTIFTVSWFIAIVMASIAGILVASLTSLDAEAIYFFGMKAFAVVIFGGLESIGGAVLAGLIIGVLEILSVGYLDPLVGGGLAGVTPFLLLMIVLLIKPFGLFGYKRIERI